MNEYILKEYLVKETIGKGTFSKVKLGINKSTGEKVAIKILEKNKIQNKSDQIRVQREIDIIKKVKHLNIVKIIQIKEDHKNIYIIMEFIDYDLFLHIVNNKRLDEKESSLYYFQLINGMEYIHSLNIVHRDLKPENLLLTKNKILKIIDFGLSNYSLNNEYLMTHCGSPSYTSPEMIAGNKYDGYAVDVWTSGIILYAMLCGYLPFEERDNKSLFKKIVKGRVCYPRFLSNNAVNLMKKILVVNPSKRITIKEIKKHPFYLEGKEIFYKRYPKLISMIEKEIGRASTPCKMNKNYYFNDENKNNFNYSSSMNTIHNYENPIKKNIKFNTIKDNENFDNESKISNSNTISTNNTYKKTIFDSKKIIINRKNGDNSDRRIKVKQAIKEISSSSSKSKINAPNFDLLKKILRGSKANSNEKDRKTSARIENVENKKEEEKKEKIFSPIQLIRKINKGRQIYENKIHMTEYRDKKRFFKKKILNGVNSNISFEEEEKSLQFLKNIYNNDSSFLKSDIFSKKYLINKSYKINKNFNTYTNTNTNSEKRIHNYNYNNYNFNNSYNKRKKNKKDFSIFNNSNRIYKPSVLYKHHSTMVDEEKSLNLSNSKTKFYNYCSYNKLKLKTVNKSKYSTKFSNTNNNSYFESYYDDENNNSRMQSYKIKKYKNNYKRHKKEKKINTSLKKNDKKIFPTNNHSLCQSKNRIVENSLSRKIISFNNLYNSIQNKYKEAQEKKNFDTIYNTNEGKVSKSKSIFSSIEFVNKTLNANSNKNKNKNRKQLKNKRNILNSDERRKKTIHNSVKNFNENNQKSNRKNVKTGSNYLNKKVKVKSKNNSMSNSINNSKININGYESHNSKKYFVDESKNANYNTNFISNCKDKPVKSKNNKIKNKNVIMHNNNKKENKNVKKYNIEEIIKKRGLGKYIGEKK